MPSAPQPARPSVRIGRVAVDLRAGLVLGIWAVATTLVLVFAAKADVGPVVLNLSDRHGVHLGDLAALVLAYTGAALSSLWVLDSAAPR